MDMSVMNPRKIILLVNLHVLFLRAISANFQSLLVKESTVIGTVVHKLPLPKDGYQYYMYDWGDTEGHALFKVDAKGQIILKQQLNFVIGRVNYYYVTAINRNQNKKHGGRLYMRKLKIIDTNNHAPVFSKKGMYEGKVLEGLPAGSIVQGLEDCFATDLDSSGVRDYSITEGNNNNEFELTVKDVNGLKLLVVKTLRSLDRDEMRTLPYLDLGIQANDGGEGDNQKFAKQIIRIHIKDINDNPPVFIYTNHHRSIQENAKISSSVMQVIASDNDAGPNSEIYYYFDSLVDEFYINPSNGEIRIASNLNAQIKDSYKLSVVAQDKSQTMPQVAKSTVNIQVLDVPNYPSENKILKMPRFLNSKYSVTLRGDLPVKSFVSIVSLDVSYISSDIVFSLSGTDSRLFKINPRSGVITLAKPINLPTERIYNLRVSIRDAKGSQSSVSMIVNVQPYYINNNLPKFYKGTDNIFVTQDININSEINAVVTARGELSKVTYHVVGGSGIGYFKVDENTGKVSTNVLFKYPGVYDLHIRVQNDGKYNQFGKMYLRVNVEPSENSSPELSRAMFTGTITEGEDPDSFVALIFARSPSADKEITYHIVGATRPRSIALNEITGAITTTQRLDYEQEWEIFMEIAVRVKGTNLETRTALLVQVVNVNDNPPEFLQSSLTVRVKENSGNIPSLVCLFATDKDGVKDNPITYTIEEGNSGNVFTIVENTGQLSVQNLDYELKSSYKLLIKASDGVHDAKANVRVEVTDGNDPPMFEQSAYTASIKEATTEELVKKLDVVSSEGKHECTWGRITLDVLKMFKLKTEPNACLVLVKEADAVQWSKDKSSHKFEVKAINVENRNEFSTTSVEVSIADINNNKPVFSQTSYTITIPGAVQLGKSILRVSATDVDSGTNSKITYDIEQGTHSNLFKAQPNGDIMPTTSINSGEYKFKVNARDQGTPPQMSTAEVKVAVIDKDEKLASFTQPSTAVSISESISVGSRVTQLQISTGGWKFEIVGGNTGDKYIVDSSSGVISIREKLDFETKPKYDLVMLASQQNKFVEKMIEIFVEDSNDNDPMFLVEDVTQLMQIYIDQFSPQDSIVAMFEAVDIDSGKNGMVSYRIQEDVPFTAEDNGSIVAKREISEAPGTEFKFTLIAIDNSASVRRNSRLTISATIQQGIRPVVFTQSMYRPTVFDNLPVGEMITHVSTSDSSGATFQVTSDVNNSFCVDYRKTVFVQRPLDFDVVRTPQFKLFVKMRQGYQSSKTQVLVNWSDENDDTPIFVNGPGPISVRVSESKPSGYVVYTAKAVDLDSGNNGRLTFSITQVLNAGKAENPFEIDAVSGEVSLTQPLDYEKCGEFVVTIKTQDNGETNRRFTLQELRVSVIDENDEIPTFSASQYNGYIPISAHSGWKVAQVFATDLDSGKFGTVTYEIINKEKYDKTFGINPSTGVIFLHKPIALLDDKTFTLNIRAQDTSLGGQAIVFLTSVTEDGPPRFALNQFVFNVTENNIVSQALGRAKAYSLDKLTYSIERWEGEEIFEVNTLNGKIYSKVSLDAEQRTKYVIYVRATDLSERFTETSVEINVMNVNDNKPVFAAARNNIIEAVVQRDVPDQNTLIVDTRGSDADIGDRVKFKINNANARAYFRIDIRGVIYNIKSLQQLAPDNNVYLFEVFGIDTEGETTSVQVRIILVNFRPGGTIIRRINELTPIDGWIVTDLGNHYPRANFKIVYPFDNPFTIDDNSGYLGLRRMLDYETTREYDLVIEESDANQQSPKVYNNYKVKVQVTDANDNDPQLTLQNVMAKVNRNAQPGTPVIKLSATDEDSGEAGSVYFQIVTEEVAFSIDTVKQEIKTSLPLSKDWYNLTIKVLDHGEPPRESPPTVVYIKTGENPPEFTQQVYQFSIQEDAKAGHVVGQVSARSLSGISIEYSIKGGDLDNRFEIDSRGNIVLQMGVDFESGTSVYSLHVQAEEISAKPLRQIAMVFVEVKNINDNQPEFTMVEYHSQPILENVDVGFTVLKVSATDCDCAQNCECAGGLLSYSMDAYTDTFRMDHVTGDIKNIRPLDYDSKPEYRFQVKVQDKQVGDEPKSSFADVTIKLKNVNDNKPTFSPDRSVKSIVENVQRGTIIITVQAQDADGDEIVYGLESEDKQNFEIGETNGVVRVTTKTNPSFLNDSYTLNITAFDHKFFGYYHLTVNIDDVNDNSPVFRRCAYYQASVDEQKPVNTQVIAVRATDLDRGRNGEVEYTLQEPQKSKNEPKDFLIDNSTGIITTNRVFDREVKSSFIVLVIALDGGHERDAAERNSASCQLEITITDKNDWAPIFTVAKYDISVAENTPVGNVILVVSAQDNDVDKNAEITYYSKMIEDKEDTYFKIDTKTGEISVTRSLLESKQREFSFQVVAVDGGLPQRRSQSEVLIYVKSSNPPRFTTLSYATSIREDKKPGELVTTVTAVFSGTGNNNKIFYSIKPGNLKKYNNPPTFTIDSRTGQIKVGSNLDYEELKEYVLTVGALDQAGSISNAEVTISVIDVNDNTPMFLSNYDFGKVAEGKGRRVLVEQVNATDSDSGLNGEVVYSLIKSKESDMFTIEPNTGKIYSEVVFDREETPSVMFIAKAEDQGLEKRLHSLVHVTIQITDINDNKPEFKEKSYSVTIKEDLKVGSKVLELQAVDKDAGENSKLNYYIVEGNVRGYFTTYLTEHRADSTSVGKIIVSKKLDHEDIYSFKMKVIASDSKYSTFAWVNIQVEDVNDNDPYFEHKFYNATIAENSPKGLYVKKVKALDKDSPEVQKPITYFLSENTKGYFVIDPQTGEIRTDGKRFDRERESVVIFQIFAKDGMRTGSATMKVLITDFNDEKPQFVDGPYLLSVKENQNEGAYVGIVTAIDRDEGENAMITYFLEDDDEGRFVIDPNTGRISTKTKLDRENYKFNKFFVIVVAEDRGEDPLRSTVEVTIDVTDANDQYPEFTRKIYDAEMTECAIVSDRVTQVSATDNDLANTVNSELIYFIASGNTPRRFRIDAATGIITVAHKLDFEKEKSYQLFISVRDKGLPQLIGKQNATVKITMQDCNDNIPHFDKSVYTKEVLEDVKVGFVIMEVSAVDDDSGINGEFDFFIEDPEENYQFTVDRKGGIVKKVAIIRLAWRLDREKRAAHSFRIGARDRGTPSKTGYAQINVKVKDVNDNGPKFDPPEFCGKVEEEVTKEQQVATIVVSDPDDHGNQCPCAFRIVDDPSGMFYLEKSAFPEKVNLKTKARFDRDTMGGQMHRVSVSATDNGTPPMESFTYVYVEVGDKKDNQLLEGGSTKIDLNAYLGQFKGGPIGYVYVQDKDRVMESQHSIIRSGNSNRAKYFSVDSSGMISAKKEVPEGSYELTVQSVEKNKAVTSKVLVDVNGVTERAVNRSVAIRMSGLRRNGTCEEVPYPDMADLIARLLNVDVSQVRIFSISKVAGMYGTVDIRFSVINQQEVYGYPAEDSFYYTRIYIITKLLPYIREIERVIGGRVISVGIDTCAKESCPLGFCYNDIRAQPDSYTIVSDGSAGGVPPPNHAKSFVSLDARVVPVCVSYRRQIMTCEEGSPCYNGGVCHVVASPSPNSPSYRCSCPHGYEGPQCQSTTRSVQDGGYFLLKPITSFYEGELTFEFSTNTPNGLLIYQGPLYPDPLRVEDFVALDLVNGKLRVSITQGEKKVFRKTLSKGNPLDDGVFHHVSIYKRGKFIRVTVDKCKETRSNQNIHLTRQRCQVNGTVPGNWRYINGIYPLQIGGNKTYITPYTRLDFPQFTGCMRLITDNGWMYDLTSPLLSYNSEIGCPMHDELCPRCGTRGTCDLSSVIPRCKCEFGWRGELCNLRTPAFNYLGKSYTRYILLDDNGLPRQLDWKDRYISRYRLQVRTTVDGVLLYERGKSRTGEKIEFSLLEIRDKRLRYSYQLGDGLLTLVVEGVNMTDGLWHNISLVREGVAVVVDVWKNDTIVGSKEGSTGGEPLLDSDGVVLVGGIPDDTTTTTDDGGDKDILDDFQGCIANIEYNNVALDHAPQVNATRQNVRNNCSCGAAAPSCPSTETCFAGSPPFCSCPEAMEGGMCPGGFIGSDFVMMGDGFSGKGMLMLIVIFILFMALLATLAFVKSKPRKGGSQSNTGAYVDPVAKENIMMYADEGAGEDDFINYDLEKLLLHANGGKNLIDQSDGLMMREMNQSEALLDNGYAGGAAETQALLHSETTTFHNETEINHFSQQQQNFTSTDNVTLNRVNIASGMEADVMAGGLGQGLAVGLGQAEDVDFALFISNQLEMADADDCVLPRDSLLHYGYEGEGSDMSDLSELGESESESEDEAEDFSYLGEWGPEFKLLDRIYNPHESDLSDDDLQ